MTFPLPSILCKPGPCSANASCYIINDITTSVEMGKTDEMCCENITVQSESTVCANMKHDRNFQ